MESNAWYPLLTAAMILSGSAVQEKDLGFSLVSATKRLMAAWRSTREWKTPRLRRRFVSLAMKRYGRPVIIVTDKLRSYRAAMKVIGNEARQATSRWLNDRAENSHQPFRRREAATATFRAMKTLQKFAAAHASIHNHFNQDRHLNRRDIFKQNRAAALAEWRELMA